MVSMYDWEECPYCSGTGDLSETVEGTVDDMDEDCPHCEGTGAVQTDEDETQTEADDDE